MTDCKKSVKKACKMKDPVEQLACLPQSAARKTLDGEELTFETSWATNLSEETMIWILELFIINMKEMYQKSQWGYDLESKKHELGSTTARFILARNSKGELVGYTHYRFVDDHDVPVVYCYEIQVIEEYQKKGVGTLLLNTLETLAEKTAMDKVMATVFMYNSKSLGFFHKNGYSEDATCPPPEVGLDYVILSKFVC